MEWIFGAMDLWGDIRVLMALAPEDGVLDLAQKDFLVQRVIARQPSAQGTVPAVESKVHVFASLGTQETTVPLRRPISSNLRN